MKKDMGFLEYIENDIFGEIEGIRSRAMFGGWSFYKDGIIFAMIADGKLYFKVGESNILDYQTAGMKPFTYSGKNGKVYQMAYWELPEEVLNDREELLIWMDKSVQEGLKKKK